MRKRNPTSGRGGSPPCAARGASPSNLSSQKKKEDRRNEERGQLWSTRGAEVASARPENRRKKEKLVKERGGTGPLPRGGLGSQSFRNEKFGRRLSKKRKNSSATVSGKSRKPWGRDRRRGVPFRTRRRPSEEKSCCLREKKKSK